jgi:hypothetical protein
LITLSVALAEPAPAMVTLVRGPVTLVEAGKTSTPVAPLLFTSGQVLDVGAGGHVVLLRQGGAFTIDGPRRVDLASLQAPAAQADPVGSLLEKRTSLASAGASRGGTVKLLRPIPGAPVLELHEVRWACGCGPQDVVVHDLRADTPLWTTNGEEGARYDGPALAPGTYLVRIGGFEQAFRVAARTEADAALVAARAETVTDPADRAAITAGALLLAGYPTDALDVLEGAGLTALVGAYERLVIAP